MKPALRADIEARRHSTILRDEHDGLRTSQVLTHLQAMNPHTIACYVSVDPEPDTLTLLGELHQWGLTILLPCLLPGSRTPLWSRWAGEPMISGWGGIPTPSTKGTPDVLSQADVIIMPGLAGTLSGARLGTGGGWYDQALLHANPKTPRWLLLNDDEVVDALPQDIWDQPVTDLVTEKRWIVVES